MQLDASAVYAEYDALQAVFELLDSDRDGVISPTEWRYGCELLNKELGGSNDIEADALFKVIDQNGDGKIELSELHDCIQVSGRDRDGRIQTHTMRQVMLMTQLVKMLTTHSRNFFVCRILELVIVWRTRASYHPAGSRQKKDAQDGTIVRSTPF